MKACGRNTFCTAVETPFKILLSLFLPQIIQQWMNCQMTQTILEHFYANYSGYAQFPIMFKWHLTILHSIHENEKQQFPHDFNYQGINRNRNVFGFFITIIFTESMHDCTEFIVLHVTKTIHILWKFGHSLSDKIFQTTKTPKLSLQGVYIAH